MREMSDEELLQKAERGQAWASVKAAEELVRGWEISFDWFLAYHMVGLMEARMSLECAREEFQRYRD